MASEARTSDEPQNLDIDGVAPIEWLRAIRKPPPGGVGPMRPFYMTVTTLVHGLFTAMVLLVLVDVASPTFNVDGMPVWSGTQAVFVIVTVLTVSFALGLVMNTVSRGVFHKQKRLWTLELLSSAAVRNRLAALGTVQTSPGGPTYSELADEDAPNRVIKAAAFMQGVEYQVMVRAPHVYQTIQMYRDQYRMARAFILPLALLAFIIPFWAPVAALDGAGSIGPFPIIRSQAFMLSLLGSAVSFVAFRERAYRYAAATALAWITLEGIAAKGRDDD